MGISTFGSMVAKIGGTMGGTLGRTLGGIFFGTWDMQTKLARKQVEHARVTLTSSERPSC